MKCWRCGNEMALGSSKCIICSADQNRSVPKTVIGKAMRQLYDRYGRNNVLVKKEYLDKGLGDLLVAINDVPDDPVILRSRIRTAMNAGLGKMYLDQLVDTGRPDETFDLRVKTLLIEDAGLSDKAAKEIIGYYDEMIGWRADSVEIPRPVPVPDPIPEPAPVPKPVPTHQSDGGYDTKDNRITRKLYLFEIIGLVVMGYEYIVLFITSYAKNSSLIALKYHFNYTYFMFCLLTIREEFNMISRLHFTPYSIGLVGIVLNAVICLLTRPKNPRSNSKINSLSLVLLISYIAFLCLLCLFVIHNMLGFDLSTIISIIVVICSLIMCSIRIFV